MGDTTSTTSVVVRSMVITPSGVLSPGPLSMAAVAVGAKLGWIGGVYLALGHMAVELPYTMVLARSSSLVEKWLSRFRGLLTLVAVGFTAYFAADLILTGLGCLSYGCHVARSLDMAGTPFAAFLAGVVFTGANVFFLLWWLTVAMPVVSDTAKLGVRGFLAMYAGHVWLDYLWLSLLAGVGDVVKLLGTQAYAMMLILLAVLLMVYAADLAARSVAGRRLLPF